MKRLDILNEQALKQQRDRMGAELRRWHPNDCKLEGDGLDTDLVHIVNPGDGTLVYEDRRVAVYIRDQYNSSDSASEPETLNKVHVADCPTLQHMRRQEKYDVRYVATARIDGMFVVNFLGQFGSGDATKGVKCRLYVCKNCLRRLNYKNYNEIGPPERVEIKEFFNLGEFFEVYGSHITSPPMHTDTTAPVNMYTSDWDSVSLRCRIEANWRCSKCSDYLGDENNRRFLHVHHIYGRKYDNRAQNLQVLCIVCHAEIDDQLKNSPEYAEYRRIKQNSG